jgi:hypothetical protein
MASPPVELSEEKFLELIAQHNIVPFLAETTKELAEAGWTNDKEGLRCLPSGLMPKGVDVWVFENGCSLVNPDLFRRMKEALSATPVAG